MALAHTGTRRGRSGWLAQERTTLVGWAFALPFLIVYALFLVVPFGRGVWIALHEWNLLAVAFDPGAKSFIGLDNLRKLAWGSGLAWTWDTHLLLRMALVGTAVFVVARVARGSVPRAAGLPLAVALALLGGVLLGITPGEDGRWFDPRFHTIVANTVVFVAATVPTICVIALALAVSLDRPGRLSATLRTIFFTSQVLSVTVVTLIWQMLYSPARGLFAAMSTSLGLEPLTWLTHPDRAMASIVVTTVWWSVGFAMVLFLAGLQEIPAERYEAATLDGASAWQAFRFVTLPALSRTLTLVVVFETVIHFQVFGQSHLMTRGGPNDATQTLVRYVYQSAFRDGDLGYASALALVLFVLMLGFSIVQLRLEGDDGR